jgi:hypothetical protein
MAQVAHPMRSGYAQKRSRNIRRRRRWKWNA